MYSPTSVVSLAGLVGLIHFVAGRPEWGLHRRNGDPQVACNVLSQQYPGLVWMPGSATYNFENSRYFDVRAWLGPACVLTPNDAEGVSGFVQIMKNLSVPFAIRGGGHMPIPGYANINSSGILLSTSNLLTMTLSEDKQTASVGPGHLWQDVYGFLEPQGVNACGGRDGPTGVSGLLLGGGYSFYSNQHGFCSGSILAYEVVLASSEIVTATASNNYSDLYWALKGGGNSFGLVTRFDLQVRPSTNNYAGQVFFGQGSQVRDQYIDALYHFTDYGANVDPKASFEAEIFWFPVFSPDPIYSAWMFYDADPGSAPGVGFENFTAPKFTPVFSTFGPQNMSSFSTTVGFQTTLLRGARERFYCRSFYNNPTAYRIFNDVFFGTAQQLLSGVKDVGVTLALGPATTTFIQQTMGPDGGQSPLGLDESKGSFLIADQSIFWWSPSDDDTIANFVQVVNQNLDQALANFSAPFIYMNDADGGQKIFEGYGKSNAQRLQTIRNKYDPGMVYTNLMPGGFKVANVDIDSIPD